MRKLSDDECPLHLRLCAGPSEKALSLVLKENETGDVNVGFLLVLKIVYDKVGVSYAELDVQLGLLTTVSLHSGMPLVSLSCVTS